MDWLTVVLAVGSVVLAAVIVIVAARVGIKIPLRGRRVGTLTKPKASISLPNRQRVVTGVDAVTRNRSGQHMKVEQTRAVAAGALGDGARQLPVELA